MKPNVKILTDEERTAWRERVAAIEAERPKIEDDLRKMELAAKEPGFSGQLRRAIHGTNRRGVLLPQLMERANIEWDVLGPFLRRQAPLPSDAIDRLIEAMGVSLVCQEHEQGA